MSTTATRVIKRDSANDYGKQQGKKTRQAAAKLSHRNVKRRKSRLYMKKLYFRSAPVVMNKGRQSKKWEENKESGQRFEALAISSDR